MLLVFLNTAFGARTYETGDIPPHQIPFNVLSEPELREVVVQQQEYILKLTEALNACSEAFVPNIMEEKGANFALFAPSWCFESLAILAGEMECPAFVIYDEVVIEEWGDPFAEQGQTY
jgi:hypothetical protein